MIGDETFEYRTDPPNRDGSLSVKLSQDELHVEEGQGPQYQHAGIWYQECSPTILIAEVGEPPHISQVHCKPDDGKKEVKIAPPGFPLCIFSCKHITQNCRLQRIQIMIHLHVTNIFTLLCQAAGKNMFSINKNEETKFQILFACYVTICG